MSTPVLLSSVARCSFWLRAVLAVGLWGGVVAPGAWADTAADVAKVNALVDRAQSNLASVDRSIGTRTSPPTGAAARLAASRLEQARDDLEPAGTLVAGLPAEGEGVANATARFNTAIALYNKLNGILTGGAAPAPADPNAPDAPETVRLSYPHDDHLKTVQSSLRDIEASVNGLMQLHAEATGTPDRITLNARQSGRAMATLRDAQAEADRTEQRLATIPANGEGVAQAKARLVQARQALAGAEGFFAPINEQLAALIDPANFPEFAQEVRWLGDTNNAYRNDTVYLNDPERMAELSSQREAAAAELIRLAQKYRAMIEANTPQGQQIENFGNATLGAFQKFDGVAAQVQQRLPAEIREHLQDVADTAAAAVENEQPGQFTGAIPQKLGWARGKLTLLVAIAETEETAALEQVFAQQEARLRTQAKQLEGLIIAANEPPADRYQGSERDAVIAAAVAGWQAEQPDAEVVAVVVPTADWSRETKWTFSRTTAYYHDQSTLQVRLLVADPAHPERVIDRPVNVRKDHQNQDRLTGVPVDSFEVTELGPTDYVLRAKLD